jgi:hypothetical protein
MRMFSVIAAAAGAVFATSLPGVAQSQAPAPPAKPLLEAPECQRGGSVPLSDRLSESRGIICPPAGIDPGIAAPPAGGGRTPVIPPPGTPGGDPSIVPK